MASVGNVLRARNLLIGAGAYFLAGWVGLPLALGFGKLTSGLIYSGDFNGNVIAPLVLHLPRAVMGAAVGTAVVWLVESDRPMSWAIFPVLLYGVLGFLGYHWAHPPTILDRAGQTVGALFPAVTCFLGALVTYRLRTSTQTNSENP
jgi:hypothetical protein